MTDTIVSPSVKLLTATVFVSVQAGVLKVKALFEFNCVHSFAKIGQFKIF
jgi:hypothetical protein